MKLAITKTRSTIGIVAQSVSVEVHLSYGLPYFTIVGLPQTAVKESKDRVRSAIINSQLEFPAFKITVNLAPADLPKMGSGFDLPIALGILAASNQLPSHKMEFYDFIGELALGGELRGVSAIIPAVLAARREKRSLIIASANAQEAAVIPDAPVFVARTLRNIIQHFCCDTPLDTLSPEIAPAKEENSGDWTDIKGQYHAKRAMEIAACGGHSILLSGPPGSGKTMLSKRFSTLLPPLTEEQAIDCAAVKSTSGRSMDFTHWRKPPFRAPHHTASPIALVGGGNPPKPGEISLAHHGVLFLDELPEFNRHVLETLREPLESGVICISRAGIQMEFPAQFQLVAAMNPCPCGHFGNPKGNCFCSPDRISRYLSKLSGPLLDRIDLQINVQALSEFELLKPQVESTQSSATVQSQVSILRERQIARQGCLNAHLSTTDCDNVCAITEKEITFLSEAIKKFNLSARAYLRLLRVSRTIADMRESLTVQLPDLQQALTFKVITHPPMSKSW